MKKLEINMSIKANNTYEAECIAKRELMDLARVIAHQNGSAMVSGEGNAVETGSGNYKVDAVIKVNANDVNAIVRTAQALWMTKPEILKSAIFVSEEKDTKANEAPKVKTVMCECCGIAEPIDNMAIVNPGLESEYYLCDECIDDARNDGDVILCDGCVENVDVSELVENPVTHEKNLCPYCGVSLI